MKRLGSSLWLLACVALCRCGGAGEHDCSFVDPPTRVVEGQTLDVTVRYSLPAGAPPATLHFEVKGGLGKYHRTASKQVAGAGVAAFKAAVPSAAVARHIQLITWMGTDWRRPLGRLVRSPMIDVLSLHRAHMLAKQRAAGEAIRKKLLAVAAGAGRVGVYQPPGQPAAARAARALSEGLRLDGHSVVDLGTAMVGNLHVLRPDVFRMVVLCDARVLPVGARDALGRYVEAGGNLVVLAGPAFDRMLWELDGKWLAQEEYRRAVVERMTSAVRVDFEKPPGKPWTRSSNNRTSPAQARHEGPGARGSAGALRVTIDNLTGWDTFGQSVPAGFFPKGHTWTAFWAKGDSATTQMSVEWRETDGSRWIATVSLTPQWQPYALPPAAFLHWRDSAAKGRGAAGDRFHPERAASIAFGLAHTHTRSVPNGRHEFWVDDLGTAPAPGDDVDREALAGGPPAVPIIPTVAPKYKLYRVTDLHALRVSPRQALVPAAGKLRPVPTLSPHPRPQGTGIHKARRWRFVPLIECLDRRGRVCGAAANLMLVGAAAAEGGAVASFPVSDMAFFDQPAASDLLLSLARRMMDGLFLYEGGARYYASFGSEDMDVGALVSNRGPRPARGDVRSRVTDAAGQPVWERSFPVSVAPGASARVEAKWPIGPNARGPFTVTVELAQEGKAIDRLSHEVRVWAPKAEPAFVQARDGDFYLNGRKWYAHGVNYMPSTGIGIEDRSYFERWLDPQPYDPDVIDRDLDDVQAIGLNMVSVFQYHQSMPSRNLLDLLMRCEERGLKANLSLRPGTPMNFPWDQVKEMIETGKLAANDTICAYDLAWEPWWGPEAKRKPFDPEWRKWIARRYRDVARAERSWGVPAPKDAAGSVTGPSTEQLASDGPWSAMAVDYRAFQNELLHERYARARELVKSIDPNHLVSFRMRTAGDPTVNQKSCPYDLAGLAKAVDIMEPEGYGRIGDWDRVKGGWFTAAYARCVAPTLPVMWAEFGYTIWNRTAMGPDPGRLEFAARFYDDFYRMAYRSGANGTVCWWFPGGYRWNERSDYGIINPDRSWRKVTEVIHAWREKMTAPRAIPKPDLWIEFDRSKHADGIAGIYRSTRDAFWRAVSEGKTPGLREVSQGQGE